jgi:hypothetical protein
MMALILLGTIGVTERVRVILATAAGDAARIALRREFTSVCGTNGASLRAAWSSMSCAIAGKQAICDSSNSTLNP